MAGTKRLLEQTENDMPDDRARRRIIDRANRMLGQSQRLRKISDELLQESKDLRTSVRQLTKRRRRKER